jgi:hypothetical protein
LPTLSDLELATIAKPFVWLDRNLENTPENQLYINLVKRIVEYTQRYRFKDINDGRCWVTKCYRYQYPIA